MTDVVNTDTGAVRGVLERGVWSFKGIPYGADTSGDGRFRPPRAPVPWSGVRECSSYGPSCPQMTVEQMTGQAMTPEVESMMGVLAEEPSVSEDCLCLNVWTPTLDGSRRLPVLVWLHGGGWSTGSASWPLYDFTNMAGRRDVVVVGINHRLGIFGFLDLSMLGDEFADSGMVGMLDIAAALAWTRTNISGFGGNPDNVTVFGESGGGLKTSTLLSMPSALQLFHKAAPMSGAALTAKRPERAQETTEFVVNHLGVGHDIGRLQAVDAFRLVETELAVQARGGGALMARGFGPVLGPHLPAHPGESVRAGSAASVPLMTGCTTDEMLAFMQGDPELWTLSDEGLEERLHRLLGEPAESVLSAYRLVRPNEPPTALLISIATDVAMRIPHVRLAESKLAGGGEPVWMYLFAWGRSDPNGCVRAAHGADMPYFFDNTDKAPVADGPQAAQLISAMNGALVAFATTGNPNHADLPDWPAYDLADRSSMRFDVPSVVELDPMGVERRCWDDLSIGEET